MLRALPARRVSLLMTAALALASCDGDGTATGVTTSITPTRFLVVHLTPSEGELVWRLSAGQGAVELSPALSWEVQFVAPSTGTSGNMRVLYVVLQLRSDAAGATCFEAADNIQNARAGFSYTVGGSAFRLATGATASQNLCGNDFDISTAEVSLRESRNGSELQTFRFPCTFHASRAVAQD